MKITEVPFDIVGYMMPRFDHPVRTDGLHLSRIYTDLDKFINKSRYTGGFTEEDLGNFGLVGFVWERILETTLADITISGDPARFFRPGELEVDGILGTPDYCDLDFRGDGTNTLGLEEWKASWKSVNALDNFEKNFWRWLVQSKGYCHMLGTTLARFRTLSIVGDWKQSITPVARVFEIEYSPTELQENWDMLRNHATRKGWR